MKLNSPLSSTRAFVCLSTSLLITSFTIRAATISWTNTSGGAWSSPANWSPHVVPGFFDVAQINAVGTYTVTIDTNVAIASLTLGGASGVQTLANSTQTVAITNGSVVTANGILSLGGGTLSGGPMSLQGTLNWAGATVNLPLTVSAGGVLSFTGGTCYVEGPLTNSGTINWSGASSYVSVYNNHGIYTGIIYNQPTGVFNIQNDQTLYTGGYGFESFINAGTVQKTAGVATTTFGISFTNLGTVNVQSGAIHFTGGGNLGGTYNTASGAAIEFDAGSFVQNGSVTVTGTGVCRQYGATVTLDQRITKFVLANGNVQLSPTFQGGGTIQNLQLDGATLMGTNTVTGTLGINGGGVGAASPLTVALGGVLNFNGAAVNLYSPLTNYGTVNWSGGSGITLNNNNGVYTAIFYNQPSGLLDLQSDQPLYGGYNSEAFYNAGTVRKTAGLGITTIGVPFMNSGTVDAQSGTIRFSAGGNVAGTYNTVPGSIVEFYGGSFSESGLVTITGGGLCRLNGANVTLNDRIPGFLLNSGNVILASTFQNNGTIQSLQLDGATLTGTNTVTGTLGINGGSVGTASPLTVAVGGVLNFNGAAVNLYSPLTNSGTINWSGAAITLNNNNGLYTAIFYNRPSGLVNLQNDQNLFAGYNFEAIYNAGTVRKTAGLGITTIAVPFTNSGTVDAQSGTIRFSAGGNVAGTYNTVLGSIVEFYSGSFLESGSVTVTGGGLCRLNGANVTLNNRIAGFLLNAGNVALTPTFQNNGAIQNLQLDGATLVGRNVVAGTLGINGGTIGSASPLTVAVGGVLNFNGAAVSINAPVTNWGTINWSGSAITVNNNNGVYTGIINNQSSGLFNIQADQNLFTGAYGFELFNNSGTVRKTAGLSVASISVPFNNTGTLDAQAGTLRFAGPYAQTGGVMNFGITSLGFYGQIAFTASAPLTGTLSVNFNDGYSPSVGDSFTVLSYASRSGIFAGLALPAAAQWQTNYGASSFTLSVVGVNTNVLAPVKLIPISYVAGHFTVQVTGSVGPEYVILASTNLSSWIGISTSTPSVMPFTVVDSNAGLYPRRFYRALLGP